MLNIGMPHKHNFYMMQLNTLYSTIDLDENSQISSPEFGNYLNAINMLTQAGDLTSRTEFER